MKKLLFIALLGVFWGCSPTSNVPTLTKSGGYHVGQKLGTNGEDGIVFWVDGSREHGLACSPEILNNGSGLTWNDRCSTTDANDPNNGKENTTKIIAIQDDGIAALCNKFKTANTNEGDWYLPASEELKKFLHSNVLPHDEKNFWSSEEKDDCFAKQVKIVGDFPLVSNNRKTTANLVIAIRAF